MFACEVISPATTHRFVVTSVAHATRLLVSCSSIASRTASEIWSATLSGWPIETDSDVKKTRSAMARSCLRFTDGRRQHIRAPARGALVGGDDGLRFPAARGSPDPIGEAIAQPGGEVVAVLDHRQGSRLLE